jgi:hypothetical protein
MEEEIMPKNLAKIRTVQDTKSHLRLNLIDDIKWKQGDVIQFEVVDEDRVNLKRVVKAP